MSQRKTQIELLEENLAMLRDSINWLDRSYGICTDIGVKDSYSAIEFDAFETLCSRFARTTDLLVNKIFRSIDLVELVSGGTLIDSVNRSVKRNIVSSLDEVRRLKDLRNIIAHEYVSSNLWQIFQAVIEATESIQQISAKTLEYCIENFYGNF